MIHPTEETVWSLFLRLENEPAAKRFLTERYREQGVENAERAAYLSSQPFRYYLTLGRETIHSLRTCDPLIQPLPAYYGMMHLMKAIVLSRMPDYPQNTSVLRHGLSTRKRKKACSAFGTKKCVCKRRDCSLCCLACLGYGDWRAKCCF